MNSNSASCSAARPWWITALAYAICVVGVLWFVLLSVKDLAVAFVWSPSKEWLTSDRRNAGCIAIVALSLAFLPGLFCLFFYLFAPSAKMSGIAAGMSWWWVWLT